MAKVCHYRNQVSATVSEAAELPSPDMTFDGVRADRTFQHLEDSCLAFAQLAGVSKPGARIVSVDLDYDTQVMESADQALARSVLRYRADMIRSKRSNARWRISG